MSSSPASTSTDVETNPNLRCFVELRKLPNACLTPQATAESVFNNTNLTQTPTESINISDNESRENQDLISAPPEKESSAVSEKRLTNCKKQSRKKRAVSSKKKNLLIYQDKRKCKFTKASFQTEVKIGMDHQAEIPEILSHEELVNSESDDRLIWNPYRLSDEDIEDYLKRYNSIRKESEQTNLKRAYPGDDEEAFLLLQQSNYNIDEALKIREQTKNTFCVDVMSLWSDLEKHIFERSLVMCTKNFHYIQKYHMPWKGIKEIVEYYYFWKKSDQCDVIFKKKKRSRAIAPLSESM